MFIKPLLLFAALFCSEASPLKGNISVSTWIISGEGSLRVAGSTNINKFSCDITNFVSPDTLLLFKDFSQETIKMSGSIQLDIKRFDCNNNMMTKDLRKALRAGDFPRMRIRFISLGWLPDSGENDHVVAGLVAISLAGVTRKFDVKYIVSRKAAGVMQLKGIKRISFSDFNIIPPGKLGGIVKTNNDLNVEFNLRLAQLRDNAG